MSKAVSVFKKFKYEPSDCDSMNQRLGDLGSCSAFPFNFDHLPNLSLLSLEIIIYAKVTSLVLRWSNELGNVKTP